MAASRKNNVFSTTYPSGIAFVGAIILGVALGLLKQDVAPYTLLGAGAGFVLVAFISLASRNSRL